MAGRKRAARSVVNGRYEVVSRLGEGGQGSVYEVVDRLRPGEGVALKTLFAGAPGALLRLEFAVLAKLQHPHLVRVHDLGRVTEAGPGEGPSVGAAFFTQELVPGEPSQRWSAELSAAGRASRVAEVGVAVARALAELHERGLLHRDVKPSNILVGDGGELVKLIDLGLARPSGGSDDFKAGTVRYMAPEALRGLSDERSDLYSLGATLGELLTGRAPKVLAPLPRRRPNELPEKLWRLVERLVDPRPERRYQSARETVLAFGRAMGAEILGSGREGEIIDAASEPENDLTRAARARGGRLVGRDKQLGRLGKWLGRAFGDPGAGIETAVVSGQPGVGKTRLVRTAVVEAQLRAAGEGGVVPTLVAGRLQDLVRSIAGDDAEAGSPVGRWLGGPAGAGADPAGEGETGRLLGSIARALAGMSQPSVLLVEDGDESLAPELLSWLTEVGGDREGPGLAVVVEMRDQAAARRTVAKSGGLRVDLKPLARDAEKELVASVLGRPPEGDFVKRLHVLTGGVPLLTEAALASLLAARTDGRIEGESLTDLELGKDPGALVLAGLDASLDGPSRGVADALAVLGTPATVDELMAVAALEEPEAALEAVHRLERQGWLFRDGEERLLLSGFVSRCLTAALSAKRSRALHRNVLAVLEGRPDADPGALAGHAAAAGAKKRAVELARTAAEGLTLAGDLIGAARQLEILLTVVPAASRPATELELARRCRQTGQYERAVELAEGVEQRGGARALRASLERAAALRLGGSTDDALELLGGLLEAPDGEVRLEARALAARIRLDRGDLDEARRHIGDLDGEPGEALMRSGALATGALISLMRGDLDEAEERVEAGLEAARHTGDLRHEARFRGLEGMVHHGRGRWGEAAAAYAGALGLADTAGDRHGAATYCVNLAAAYTELERIRDALDCYRDGLGRLRRIGRAAELAQAGANYAQLLLRAGDGEGAEKAASQAVKDARSSRAERVMALALSAKGDALLSRGKIKKARGLFVDAEKRALKGGVPDEIRSIRQQLAAASLSAGEPIAAREWLDRSEEDGPGDGRLALEGRRLAVEIALLEGGDVGGALGELVAALPSKQGDRRLDQLGAFATAARAARTLEDVDGARELAGAVLALDARLAELAPSLHREARTPQRKELGAIVREFANAEQGEVPAERWERLVRINTRLNSELRVGRLLELIMDTAVEVTGAERGFLLITGADGALRVRCARNIDKESLAPGEQSYSRSIATRAFETGEPVLTTDAQEDERFGSALSVVNLDLRYIAAVPLNVKGKTTGAIYLDSRGGGRFDEGRLKQLLALADQAAIALTNARLSAEVRKRQRHIEKLNRRLAARLETREGELERVRGELERRTDEMITRYRYEEIVARSPAMGEVFKLLDKVVSSELPVVVEGESGTGKELVARAIHFNGARRRGPFVAENCGAIPETLLESVLFGHVKGAFTGAIRDSSGLFLEANGGTLFLDEVSAMPLAMQVKLLRVLQDGEVRAVGGGRTTVVDTRVVVASNTDLKAMVREGTFREDLFYRLNVVHLALPPLRKRTGDIPLLTEHFLRKHGGADPPVVSREVLEALIDYPWPGNVRQLENEIMRAIVLADDSLEIDHLSEEIITGVSGMSESIADLDLTRQVERLKKRLTRLALRRTGGNQTAAAELLGLSRYGLQKMLARFDS